MSSTNVESVIAKPFGDETDPRGFWLLLKEHLAYLRMRNYAASTMRRRAIYVRAFALWALARDLPQAAVITKPIMESYQRHLFRYRKADGRALAWSSQNLQLGEVATFFRWLVKKNHIAINPAAELERPKQPKRLPQAILSVDEVEAVMAQPDTATALGLRDRAILEVFYSTGIRRMELCRLLLEDVHVDRHCLFVRQGKGQKDRYVPIGIRALLWVARYVENARDHLLMDAADPTLFISHDGHPLSPDTLTGYTRRYIEAAGVNKPGACHIFRHTMATLMHEGGADLASISAILGHERLETTQIYTRTSMRKLMEIHAQTHPAERGNRDSDSETC